MAASFLNTGNKKDNVVSTDTIASLSSRQTITQADINKLNKDDLFWAYFKQASQQSKLVLTKEVSFTNTPEQKPLSISITRTGFDYQTNEIMQAQETYSPEFNDRDKRRCYDGKEYYLLSTGTQPWREVKEDDRMLCAFPKADTDINDGMNTGGLTSEQADAFVNEIRSQKGLFTVSDVTVISKNNTQYLQFNASLSPIESGKYGYIGNQWWMWAFKKTGLDPSNHHYGYSGAGGEGLNIQYIVDPNTKLPVYTELHTTSPKDKNGKEMPADSYGNYRMTYAFGTSTFDAKIDNTETLILNW